MKFLRYSLLACVALLAVSSLQRARAAEDVTGSAVADIEEVEDIDDMEEMEGYDLDYNTELVDVPAFPAEYDTELVELSPEEFDILGYHGMYYTTPHNTTQLQMTDSTAVLAVE